MADVLVDSSWSWLVSVGAFVATLLEIGMIKALGVLLPILRSQYASETWVIGLIISLVPGFGAISCPLAGALAKRYSARNTVMAFNLLSAIGLVAGSMSVSVSLLLVAFLLTGFSIGAEGIVIGEVAKYFSHKNYSVANSITQSGIAVGVIILPLLTQFLENQYGWRGAMLILGGIKLQSIISGALLRPVSTSRVKYHVDSSIKNKEINIDMCAHDEVNATKRIQEKSNEDSEKSTNILSDMIFYLDLTLFQDKYFVSMALYNLCNGYFTAGWLIYLVPYGIEIGLDPYMASALATFGGLGQLLGNIMFPLILRILGSLPVLYSATVVSFLALLANPLAAAYYSYIGFVCASVVFGTGRGVAILAFYQDCKQKLDPTQITNAVMWFHVFYSIGAIFSGFLSGLIFDRTSNYATSFVLLSAVTLVSVLPRFVVHVQSKIKC